MTLSAQLRVAGGSVTGRDHRRAERDGQDGFALVAAGDVVAVVVTDGCSSGGRSEVGARLGASWLAALVEQRFAGPVPDDAAARRVATEVTNALVDRLTVLARSLDPAGDVSAARVDDALLFTFLVAVATPAVTLVFGVGVGDGVVANGDDVRALDPGPDNAPPYVAYRVLGVPAPLRVHLALPTADVTTIAIATDGCLPALAELPALAGDPRLARNPSLLRKRLVVLSDAGTFHDDATVAILQRGAA